jgi:chemotaxis protein MotB
MSFADLMSALLLVFALLLMVNMLGNQVELEAKDQIIEEVVGVRSELIEELTNAFSDSSLEMEIDPQTGSIRFSSGVFFEFNSAELSDEGIENLRSFIPQYIGVLLSDQFKEHISEIIIEGHTDRESSYLFNLQLSQDRAFSVTEEIFSDDFPEFDAKEELRHIITSNGRSFMVPIEDENGEIDADRSRRVEFKFRLKDDQVIEQIQELVTEDEL